MFSLLGWSFLKFLFMGKTVTIRLLSACHQNETCRQKGCSLKEVFVYSTFFLFSLQSVSRANAGYSVQVQWNSPFCGSNTEFAQWHSRTMWGERRRETGILVRFELHSCLIGSKKALQLGSSSTGSLGSRRACGEQAKTSAPCLFWRKGQLAGSSWT